MTGVNKEPNAPIPLHQAAGIPAVHRTALGKLIDRYETLDVDIQFGIFSGEECIAGQRVQEPVFAASTGKLPLACMAVELLQPETELTVAEDGIDGPGKLDVPTSPAAASVAILLDDMLCNSGNTAYRVLASHLGGPDALRAYYEQHWQATTVHAAPHGRTFIGESTPEETYAQLHSLLTATSGNTSLRQVAIDALRKNTVTKYGIRQSTIRKATIFNKTGEYNGDGTDPRVFRHDVGLLRGSEGELGYAIMTTSPQDSRGYAANTIVGKFGAELAKAVGGRDMTTIASRVVAWTRDPYGYL